MRTDSYIGRGLAAVLTLNNIHSHPIINAHILSLRPAATITKKRMTDCFNGGYSQVPTKRALMKQLKDEEVDELADAAINPRNRVIYYQYDKWRSQTLGGRSTTAACDLLRSRITEYAEAGHEVRMDDELQIVVIVSSIMKRAHSLLTSKDICFIDSTASCNAVNNVITFMLSPSVCGGIPLGVIISDSTARTSYRAGFELFKKVMGPSAFASQQYPSIFMTDDSESERQAIADVWPNSERLLCLFHVAQAVWRWLWEAKHGIPKQVCAFISA